MSSLTTDQLKKIEEKRKKALELKQKKSCATLSFDLDVHTRNDSTTPNSSFANQFIDKNVKCSVVNGGKFTVFCKYSPNIVSVFKSIPSRWYNPTSKTWTFPLSDFSLLEKKLKNIGLVLLPPENAVLVKNASGEKCAVELNSTSDVKRGKCYLVNRMRFEVDLPFDADCVGLFKTFSTKSYNVSSRKWSFDLSDYFQLYSKLKTLSTVDVEPLSSTVLTVFKKRLEGKATDREQVVSDSDLENSIGDFLKLLMPFQKEGVKFAISKSGRILLADDMGLGKTVQSICIASYYKKEWPLLVICPSSVRLMWKEALLKWLPSVIHADDIDLINSGRDAISNSLVSIISYDLLAKVQKDVAKKQFQVLIVDESHFIKNFKTARTRAVTEAGKNAKRLILLSGTPALSRPVELFTQLSLLRSDLFPRFHQFGLRYCGAKQSPWGWEYTDSSNMEELRLILEETIMLRRTKDDVLTQLPPKVRRAVTIDVESRKKNSKSKETFQKAFDAFERKGISGVEKHGALLQFFNETAELKLPAVKSYVLDLLEGGHKFLVFAHHKLVLNALQNELDKKKCDYMRVDGSTPSEKRQSEVARFQENSSCRVALLSITAANMGINLHAASLVVFAELFWNPGILVQAEDRCYRIGQRDVVNVHYLVARGTSDDYIWEMVKKKLNVLSQAGLNKSDFDSTESHVLKKETQNSILQYFQSEGGSNSRVAKEETSKCNMSLTDEELQQVFDNENQFFDDDAFSNDSISANEMLDQFQTPTSSQSNRSKRNEKFNELNDDHGWMASTEWKKKRKT